MKGTVLATKAAENTRGKGTALAAKTAENTRGKGSDVTRSSFSFCSSRRSTSTRSFASARWSLRLAKKGTVLEQESLPFLAILQKAVFREEGHCFRHKKARLSLRSHLAASSRFVFRSSSCCTLRATSCSCRFRLEVRKQRQCLSHEGSGTTGQRRCLTADPRRPAGAPRTPCVVRDANIGQHLADGNSSWCPGVSDHTPPAGGQRLVGRQPQYLQTRTSIRPKRCHVGRLDSECVIVFALCRPETRQWFREEGQSFQNKKVCCSFYPRRILGKSKMRILIQSEIAISTLWIPTRR